MQNLRHSSLPLRAEFLSDGSLHCLLLGETQISLRPGQPWEPSSGPVFLRIREKGQPTQAVALLDAGTTEAVAWSSESMAGRGQALGLHWQVEFFFHPTQPACFWMVTLANPATTPVEADLLFLHDLALHDPQAVLLNTFYVSHYVDHTALFCAQAGWSVASRQNLSVGGRHPWCLTGSLGRACSWATDRWQTHGLPPRLGRPPCFYQADLPGARWQGEHAQVALQETAFALAPGSSVNRGFFMWFQEDHPEASSPRDLVFLHEARAFVAQQRRPSCGPWRPRPAPHPLRKWFEAPPLPCQELSEKRLQELFGSTWNHVETTPAGQLYSFFTPAGQHVVTRAKESVVLRPHGHILRTGSGWTPDEAALTATCWMQGLFCTMLTQGHVSINRLLTTATAYPGFFRAAGLRGWMEDEGRWFLLDTPSFFVMTLTGCRWWYAFRGGEVEVRMEAHPQHHRLEMTVAVREGPPRRFFFAAQLALDGRNGQGGPPAQVSREGALLRLQAAPDSEVGRRFPDGYFALTLAEEKAWAWVGGEKLLAPDGALSAQPQPAGFLCLLSQAVTSTSLAFTGHLVETPPVAGDFFERMASPVRFFPGGATTVPSELEVLATMVPWLAHNAGIHYLAPRGLEQYSGGGWGTRDVCQGAFDFLLAVEQTAPARDLLRRVFRQQNPAGDWPQWFMFFDREKFIRPAEAHGDVHFWPLVALGRYLLATKDAAILAETEPFFEGPPEPLREHVRRALAYARRRVVHPTHLAAYGHGDWNDAMQPTSGEWREHLCSTWTVQLHFHALGCLAQGLDTIGEAVWADELRAWQGEILRDFQALALPQGACAGLLLFAEEGAPEPLLHPADTRTGIRRSLLPLVHGALWELFTPEQVAAHLSVLQEELVAPDAARLFDRPVRYAGGVETWFQRAESAAYFGREIGLAYFHAHLRYAEMLAHLGQAEAFYHALRQAIPIGLEKILPTARPRQANCYFSSSDAQFPDRTTAAAHYEAVRQGQVPCEGGWRIYSSGPGLMVSLVYRNLLGLRRKGEDLVLDPVIPPRWVELVVEVRWGEGVRRLHYHLGEVGVGVRKVMWGNQEIPCTRLPHPYREGPVLLPGPALQAWLSLPTTPLEIWLR